MSLNISISEPQEVYRPGDQVAGVVTFTSSTKAITAQDVIVKLQHRSQCRFGLPELEALYSADITLNEQTIELLESPTTLQPGHEWPFKFIIPSESTPITSPFREPSRIYNDASDQILPPSFAITKKDTANPNDSAKITLGIHAEVVTDRVRSIFKKDTIQAVSLLPFLPMRNRINVDFGMTTKQSKFEVRTPLLAETNGNRSRNLSISEKIKTSIKSSSLPAASFDILMSLPKTTVVGQIMPLFIGLQHAHKSNSAQEDPPVVVKSFTLTLNTITSLRGLSESKSLFRDEYLPASHTSFRKKVELVKLTIPIELKDIIDLREHVSIRIPEDIAQSFKTFNIARIYSLDIQMGIECAKQKLNATFEHQLELLAPHDFDAANPPGVSTARPLSLASVPPTWEESGGYANYTIPEEKEELPPQYA